MTRRRDWKDYFADDDPLPPSASRARELAEGACRLLELERRSRVLDLGCGDGREAMELSRLGHRVLGVDRSHRVLVAAREAARGKGLNVHFMAAEFDAIPYVSEFDAVVNLHNPIGLWADKDDLHCLKSVARALKPGGKLLLDLLNREWLVRRIGADASRPEEGLAFDLYSGRLVCREPGEGFPLAWADGLRLYSLTEITELLSQAGLSLSKAWGCLDGSPYGLESLRMVVLARKVATPSRKRADDGLPRALRIKGRPR